jgi:hypothetical protein
MLAMTVARMSPKEGAGVTAAVTPAPTGPWEEDMPVFLRTVRKSVDTIASELQ